VCNPKESREHGSRWMVRQHIENLLLFARGIGAQEHLDRGAE
jgi:hypothetical protein